jgi:exoribonuclease II
MPPSPPPLGSLVLYKSRPARVKESGDKLAIELPDGKTAKVRPKDVTLLHPGPMSRLALPQPESLEVLETVWELLDGQPTNLSEVCELLYGDFSPSSAWAAWEQVADGLYFSGPPEALEPCPAASVIQERQRRQQQTEAADQRQALLERLRRNSIEEGDRRHLAETEQLAWGRRDNCRLLRELGREQSPESAHELLLRLGLWTPRDNPYPQRLAVSTASSQLELTALSSEERLDLTHLDSWAIDDEGSNDPDDAISLDGDTLWVHVADVAALVQPESAADLEARNRGATLYLPEGSATMLPAAATAALGLGLADRSPALSFGLRFDSEAEICDIRIAPTWVRVQRLSYAAAEPLLAAGPLAQLYTLSLRLRQRRQDSGAVFINYPEVKIRLQADGRILIHPLPPHQSRELVLEAMLAAGQAAARFGIDNDIPLPFTQQPQPEPPEHMPEGLAGMLALRRTMRPAAHGSHPGPHAGLGLPVYSQATSPLRRYLDLVVHQQLRAFVLGQPLMDSSQIGERVGAAQAVNGQVRQAERLSNRHWILVFLSENPGWRGQAVLVSNRQRRPLALLPELGLEVPLHLDLELPLNSELEVELLSVNLPQLEAHFRRV